MSTAHGKQQPQNTSVWPTGTAVMNKSGGPRMTVESSPDGKVVTCTWPEGGSLAKGRFLADVLKAAPAPRAPAEGHTMPPDPGSEKMEADATKLAEVQAGVEQKTTAEARKEGDEDVEKCGPGMPLKKGSGPLGEGSRGGHIIGHTHSGKPIYDPGPANALAARAHTLSQAARTPEQHKEAEQAHVRAAEKLKGIGHDSWQHEDMASGHKAIHESHAWGAKESHKPNTMTSGWHASEAYSIGTGTDTTGMRAHEVAHRILKQQEEAGAGEVKKGLAAWLAKAEETDAPAADGEDGDGEDDAKQKKLEDRVAEETGDTSPEQDLAKEKMEQRMDKARHGFTGTPKLGVGEPAVPGERTGPGEPHQPVPSHKQVAPAVTPSNKVNKRIPLPTAPARGAATPASGVTAQMGLNKGGPGSGVRGHTSSGMTIHPVGHPQAHDTAGQGWKSPPPSKNVKKGLGAWLAKAGAPPVKNMGDGDEDDTDAAAGKATGSSPNPKETYAESHEQDDSGEKRAGGMGQEPTKFNDGVHLEPTRTGPRSNVASMGGNTVKKGIDQPAPAPASGPHNSEGKTMQEHERPEMSAEEKKKQDAEALRIMDYDTRDMGGVQMSKGGPGSGVRGHTTSGKPIMHTAGNTGIGPATPEWNAAHANFTADEHKEAAAVHDAHSMGSKSSEAAGDQHYGEQRRHMRAAEAKGAAPGTAHLLPHATKAKLAVSAGEHAKALSAAANAAPSKASHREAAKQHTAAMWLHSAATHGEGSQNGPQHVQASGAHEAQAEKHAAAAKTFRKSEGTMSNDKGLGGWLSKAGSGIPGATDQGFDAETKIPTREQTRVDAGGPKTGIPGAGDPSGGDDPVDTLHDGTPSIEPGAQANGHWLGEDGVKSAPGKNGQQLENTRSGKGPENGIPGASGEKVETSRLSADDQRAEVEPKQEKVPEKDSAMAGRDLNKGGSRDVEHELSGNRIAALRRAVASGAGRDITFGIPKVAAPAPLAKGQMVNGVLYDTSEDERMQKAGEADQNYYNGGAAAGAPSIGVLQKSVCPACHRVGPSFLSKCTNCGYCGQDSAAPMVKSAASLMLQPRREAHTLYLPNGTKG